MDDRLLVVLLCLLMAAGSTGAAKDQCTSIQDGSLHGSDGNAIETGYDSWGYNYQAQAFNGRYCDAYRNASWCQAWEDVDLAMKWNDAWISNKDCDGDGKLDRHYGHESYIGSGAWLTNHQGGTYLLNGTICRWGYFTKIVAAPLNGYVSDGMWYEDDGTEIGPVIWRQFAIIQEVENDPCQGLKGSGYNSPSGSGLRNR
ncbi:hypothetical protein ACFLRF_02055 [Candidatus Altiarchaeota archaeon]